MYEDEKYNQNSQKSQRKCSVMGWIDNEFKSLKNTKMDTHPTKQSQKMYQEMFSGQNTSTHIYRQTEREERERGT
jgi:hypothetical protein